MSDEWKVYSRDGAKRDDAPPFEPIGSDHASGYLPSPQLADAVNVAVTLGIPLLLTGEPGSGKTQLAWHIGYQLGGQAPLVFHAKTTSTAQDLFYRYDSLRHFHDANFAGAGSLDPMRYIHVQALGLATLLAIEPAAAAPFLADDQLHDKPRRSVVLIDEI